MKPLYMILDEVAAAKGPKAKKAKLLENDCLYLRDFLRFSFDDSIVSLLPEGCPPFDEAEIDEYDAGRINKVTKELAYFCEGGPGQRMMAPKREKKWVAILETLNPEDAALYNLMKDKMMDGAYNGLTKKLVKDAFPGLIRK